MYMDISPKPIPVYLLNGVDVEGKSKIFALQDELFYGAPSWGRVYVLQASGSLFLNWPEGLYSWPRKQYFSLRLLHCNVHPDLLEMQLEMIDVEHNHTICLIGTRSDQLLSSIYFCKLILQIIELSITDQTKYRTTNPKWKFLVISNKWHFKTNRLCCVFTIAYSQ